MRNAAQVPERRARRVPRTRVYALAWLAALPCAACLDNELEPEAGMKVVFIAQTGDFAPYREWMLFEHDVTADHGGLLGTTSVYVSELPDETTHKFAVGTILFKTMKTADSDALTIHAMSKRGGNFNPQGAAGWEYFELKLNKQGTPYILWRGEKPPSGEQYKLLLGGDTMPTTEGNCNDCHAAGHDGVLGEDLVPLLKLP